jgi:hypothetical protein
MGFFGQIWKIIRGFRTAETGTKDAPRAVPTASYFGLPAQGLVKV